MIDSKKLYHCNNCGEVEPIVEYLIEFSNGDYFEDKEYMDLLNIDKCINEIIEKNNWTDVKRIHYALYCPECSQVVE